MRNIKIDNKEEQKGRSRKMNEASATPARARGGGRGRGQGRGRGRAGDQQAQEARTGNVGSERGSRRGARDTNRRGVSIDGNRIPPASATGDESAQAKLRKEKQQGEKSATEDVEGEVCFICASPVVHNSVAPCNHRTCHICALRMRALYKTKDCAHCRVCFILPFKKTRIRENIANKARHRHNS